MKPRHLLVIAPVLPLLSLATAQTLPKMDLHMQSLDGNPHDLVGPDHTLAPLDDRVWFAQGRRRTQIRISDRARMLSEENLGYDYDTVMDEVEIDLDPLNPLNDRLFTLTARKVQTLEGGAELVFPAKITVDDIQDPAHPVTQQTFTFPDDENPTSICTSPDQDKLIVLLGDELRIYDYSVNYVIDEVTLPGVAFLPMGQTACGASLLSLLHARTTRIQTGTGDEAVALVLAFVADAMCDPKKPQPTALLIANIEDPAVPFFYNNLPVQAWQPCRTLPTAPCGDWRINGLTHLRTLPPNPRSAASRSSSTSST